MKNKSIIGLQVIITAVLLLFLTAASNSQEQPYQLTGTAGYVDTTAYDTVTVPYVKGTNVAGFITNEDETNDLVIYFAKPDSSVRDANSYVKVGPGKRLKFSFTGRKIFRKASADSVYSQVVFGEGMDLGSGGSVKSGELSNLSEWVTDTTNWDVDGFTDTTNGYRTQVTFTTPLDGTLLGAPQYSTQIFFFNDRITANSTVIVQLVSYGGNGVIVMNKHVAGTGSLTLFISSIHPEETIREHITFKLTVLN